MWNVSNVLILHLYLVLFFGPSKTYQLQEITKPGKHKFLAVGCWNRWYFSNNPILVAKISATKFYNRLWNSLNEITFSQIFRLKETTFFPDSNLKMYCTLCSSVKQTKLTKPKNIFTARSQAVPRPSSLIWSRAIWDQHASLPTRAITGVCTARQNKWE